MNEMEMVILDGVTESWRRRFYTNVSFNRDSEQSERGLKRIGKGTHNAPESNRVLVFRTRKDSALTETAN